ncbi:MAG TPA: MXAN_5187 C-terminal domain-containing protein [Polyangia bacterium]|nr:MXAN_5187 C-terminal domain-containing protein [Polyangia bacterium]
MTPDEQERLVADLETALDRLQALYNQFFMGIEKLEPTVQRKDVERKFQLLRKEKLANTALRFRLQTQIQKYNTQSNYWRRISRQIEEGTYQRDLMRARKRTEQRDVVDLAGRALAAFDDGNDRPTPVANLRESGGFHLDDPFDAPAGREPAAPSGPMDVLDDPFDGTPLAPAGRTATHPPSSAREHQRPESRFAQAAADGDPDKTPVPKVGTGAHELHEKLIADARAASGDDGEVLAEFFLRRSVPPPPPGPAAKPAPAPPKPAPPKPAPRKPAPPERPDRAAPAAVPKSSPAAGARLDEERVATIYRTYLAARRKTGESTENVTLDKVSRLLKQQLSSKENVRDFKVVIRGGKAVIKTVKDE